MFWYPLLAVLIWSGNAIVCKLAAGTIEPGVIAFYRWLRAWLLVTPFMARTVWQQRQQIRPHLRRLMILALLGMMLNQSLGYYAAQSISAVNIGILNALIPLLTVLLSLWLLRDTPTLGVATGSVLSFAGLLWLVSEGQPARLLAQGISQGDLLMMLYVLTYAFYCVLLKRWSLPFSGWLMLYLQMSAALLWLLPDFLRSDSWALTADNLPLVLYAALPASLLGTLFWLQGVRHLGANRTAIFMNLLPLFTTGIAVLWLGERLQSYHLWGGSLTLLGVLLCQLWRQPLRAPIPMLSRG
ncbi:MAG: DMT family transporter [Aeromonadaceae bacterium]